MPRTRAAGRKVSIDHYKAGLTHYGFETPRVGEFIEHFPRRPARAAAGPQRLGRLYRILTQRNRCDLRVAGAWSNGE